LWGRNKAKFGNEDSNQGGDTLKNSTKQNQENSVRFKEDKKNQDEYKNNPNDDFREISLGGSSQK